MGGGHVGHGCQGGGGSGCQGLCIIIPFDPLGGHFDPFGPHGEVTLVEPFVLVFVLVVVVVVVVLVTTVPLLLFDPFLFDPL